MGDPTPAQRAAVTMAGGRLSTDGYRKVMEIIGGDEYCAPAAGDRGGAAGEAVNFGEDEYYLAFFGTPSTRPRGCCSLAATTSRST